MKKYRNIYFYNHYHNGDIHLSRNIIKHILKNIKFKNAYYISNSKKELFLDMEVIPLDIKNFNLNQNLDILFNQEDLYINTWIGQSNRKFLSRENAFAVSAEANKNLLNSLCEKLSIEKIQSIRSLVPDINFDSLQNKNLIEEFFIKNKNKTVLICNNYPKSFQAEANNFSEFINELTEKYKNINFLVSNKEIEIKENKNLFYIEDICKIENNLIQISYISIFCDIVFGRASGPYEVCKIKKNLFSENKKFICFCKEKIDSSWIEDIYCECEILWSNNYDHIKNILECECKKINI